MKGLTVVACACFLVLASCKDFGTPYGGSFLGAFSLRAIDTREVEMARGTLDLFREDSKVSGHWTFEDGRSGKLEGIANNGDLSLNLNPGYVDNNLLLRGTLSQDTFVGNWEQIGYPGVMARGTFVAMRIR